MGEAFYRSQTSDRQAYSRGQNVRVGCTTGHCSQASRLNNLRSAIGGHSLAQGFEAGVDQEADVGDAELRDGTDFLVRESLLELESDALLLVLGQPREILEGLGRRFAAVEDLLRAWVEG